jgi:hypothetical protein
MIINRKTTILGVLTILVAVANAIIAYLSGQPIQTEVTLAAITSGIGLILAKDHNK